MTDEDKEFWIVKGSSRFCESLELEPSDMKTMVRAKPDGFYDIVASEDTVEGGLHVVEFEALEAERARSAKLFKQAKEFINECENPSPDLYYRATLRRRFAEAVAEYEAGRD